MHYLWLDLTEQVGKIAILSSLEIPSSAQVHHYPAAMKHSELLLSEIENALNQSGLKLEELDGFVAPLGPGSYTGLRIAYATLRAFWTALNKPVYFVANGKFLPATTEKEWVVLSPDYGQDRYSVISDDV